MTYYVQTVTGNDSAAGTSIAPWLTESHALQNTAAGDIIEVSGGYVRRIYVSSSSALAGASLYGPPGSADEYREVAFGDESVFYLDMLTATVAGTLTQTSAQVAMWDSAGSLIIDNQAAAQITAGPAATVEAGYNIDTSSFTRGFYWLLMEMAATANEAAALQNRRRVFVWLINVR
jgi:hypothetical protein